MSDLAHKATLIYEDIAYTVGLHRMTGYNMLGKYCFIRLFHRLTEDFFFLCRYCSHPRFAMWRLQYLVPYVISF